MVGWCLNMLKWHWVNPTFVLYTGDGRSAEAATPPGKAASMEAKPASVKLDPAFHKRIAMDFLQISGWNPSSKAGPRPKKTPMGHRWEAPLLSAPPVVSEQSHETWDHSPARPWWREGCFSWGHGYMPRASTIKHLMFVQWVCWGNNKPSGVVHTSSRSKTHGLKNWYVGRSSDHEKCTQITLWCGLTLLVAPFVHNFGRWIWKSKHQWTLKWTNLPDKKKNIQFLKFWSRTFDDLPKFHISYAFSRNSWCSTKNLLVFRLRPCWFTIPCSYTFSMSRIKSLHVFHGFPVFNGWNSPLTMSSMRLSMGCSTFSMGFHGWNPTWPSRRVTMDAIIASWAMSSAGRTGAWTNGTNNRTQWTTRHIEDDSWLTNFRLLTDDWLVDFFDDWFLLTTVVFEN